MDTPNKDKQPKDKGKELKPKTNVPEESQSFSVDSNYESLKTEKSDDKSTFSGSSTKLKATGSSASSSGQASRESKKEQVKKCMQQLKSLVPQYEEKGGKTDTLSTLQQVIKHMLKLKEASIKSTPALDLELMGGLPYAKTGNLDRPSWLTNLVNTQKWQKIILTAKDKVIRHISPEVQTLLGYPQVTGLKRSFLDYLHKRDVETFCSSVMSPNKTNNSPGTSKEAGKKETSSQFFFRLRHFKGLGENFSLARHEKYSVFYAHASLLSYADCYRFLTHGADSGSSTKFGGESDDQKCKSNNAFIVINCVPVHPAYSLDGKLPEQCTFMTRHTINCNVNFAHPSVITLLGYLPQDMVGTSIFDYYHPQDLPRLYVYYQQVVSSLGKMYKGQPIRMRTKNGCYITVETEWSSFLNPWTKTLDFIIGQHKVISGPNNIDVFSEPTQDLEAVRPTEEQGIWRKKIWSLLHQSAFQLGQPVLDDKSQGMTTPAVYSKSGPNAAPETATVAVVAKPMIVGESPGGDTQETSSGSLQMSYEEEDESVIYDGLNYAQGIKRYLLSCTAVKDSSDTESTSTQENVPPVTVYNVNDEVDLPLPVARPPSCASSTKALVYDFEPREDPSSPARDVDSENDMMITETSIGENKPIVLTQEVLAAHTKAQRHIFIEEVVKNKRNYLLSACKPLVSFVHNKALKRHADREDKAFKKFRKNDTDEPMPNMGHDDVIDTFPLVNMEHVVSEYDPVIGGGDGRAMAQPLLYRGPGGQSMSASLLYGVHTCDSQMSSVMMQYSTASRAPITSVPKSSQCTVPTYSTLGALPGSCGLSRAQEALNQSMWPGATSGVLPLYRHLYPQMGPVTSRHANVDPLTPTGYMLPGQRLQHHIPKPNDSSEEISNESSSFITYLMESSGTNDNSGTSNSLTDTGLIDTGQHVGNKGMVSRDPPWIENINWNKDVRYKYVVPLPRKQILKSNKLAAKRLTQPEDVVKQLEEVIQTCELQEKAPFTGVSMVGSEETDYLFYKAELSERSASVSALVANEQKPDAKPAVLSCKKDSRKAKSSKKQKLDMEASGDSSKLESGSGDNDDVDSKDSNGSYSFESSELEKVSSNITNSDQRSSEEASSSLKESDSASTNSQNSGEKEPEGSVPEGSKQPHQAVDYFTKLFCPLKLMYKNKVNQIPPWLEVADFGPRVQYLYEKELGKEEYLLSSIVPQVNLLNQPDLVVEQLKDLLSDLRVEESESSECSSSKLTLKINPNESPEMVSEETPSEIQEGPSKSKTYISKIGKSLCSDSGFNSGTNSLCSNSISGKSRNSGNSCFTNSKSGSSDEKSMSLSSNPTQAYFTGSGSVSPQSNGESDNKEKPDTESSPESTETGTMAYTQSETVLTSRPTQSTFTKTDQVSFACDVTKLDQSSTCNDYDTKTEKVFTKTVQLSSDANSDIEMTDVSKIIEQVSELQEDSTFVEDQTTFIEGEGQMYDDNKEGLDGTDLSIDGLQRTSDILSDINPKTSRDVIVDTFTCLFISPASDPCDLEEWFDYDAF